MVTVISFAALILIGLLCYGLWRQRQQDQKIAEITQALDEISTATAAVAAETRATRLLQFTAEQPQQRRRRPGYLRPLAESCIYRPD